MDPVVLDTFAAKLKARVAIKSRITWADAKPVPYRLFGISERVFFIAAGLAGLSWLMMLAQGLG
jgi:hypothetical protein